MYRFRVSAINEFGQSEFSQEPPMPATRCPSHLHAASQESKHVTLEGPPDIPVALECVDQTYDSAVLIWKAAARTGASIDYFEVPWSYGACALVYFSRDLRGAREPFLSDGAS